MHQACIWPPVYLACMSIVTVCTWQVQAGWLFICPLPALNTDSFLDITGLYLAFIANLFPAYISSVFLTCTVPGLLPTLDL
jgi:hypothetical protein